MTRAQSASYIAGTMAELLTDAGLGNEDVPGELGEVIDDALLMTGTAYDDLATAEVTDDIGGYRKVLRLCGLMRVREAIAHRVDLSMDGPSMSKSRSQAVKALDKLVEDAKAAATPYIVSGEWGFGAIYFDYQEPGVTT